jgi:hypothetical protein
MDAAWRDSLMPGHRRSALIAVGLAVALACLACSAAPPLAPPAPPASAAASVAPPPSDTVTPHATAPPMTEAIDWPNQLEDIGTATFGDPTKIDNSWFPLEPGTQFVYEGFTEEEGERKAHRFVHTVTDLTKVINGVRARVVWDQDFADGTLEEAEIALFAQADDGNVWHLGEYPEVYEDGKVVEAPAWIAGIAGAQPGIIMKDRPELGGPSYSQGWSPVVPWTDRARVAQVGVQDCVPQGCYVNGIVTEEFSREEPDAFQLKYYAPGIGNTRVSFSGQDQTKETLELVSLTQLDPAAVADAQAKVLELERGAYQRSRAVYGLTAPAEPSA